MRCQAAAPEKPKLLVVGPGVLGSRLGVLWLEKNGGGSVLGLTQTTNHHGSLRALGITPHTLESFDASQRSSERKTFPNVVFSAPPSTSDDYPGEVRRALGLWDGSGAFVFTSSAALYDVHDGEGATEVSPIVARGASPRTDRLLDAERVALDAGGSVVRLVGLYHSGRGAHTFYRRKAGQAVDRWGGAVINLIHYEDAAALTLRLLRMHHPGHVFVGVDDEPITLQELMDLTHRCPAYALPEGAPPVQFKGTAGKDAGKRMANPITRAILGWEPAYPSFRQFLAEGAHDWYATLPKDA